MKSRFVSQQYLFLFVIAVMGFGCGRVANSVYYSFWEKVGFEKRDLLLTEIQRGNTNQEELEEQLSSTVERIKNKYGLEPSALEDFYNAFNADYLKSKAKSEELNKRIQDIRTIASDLFREWSREAKQISDPKLQTSSLAQLERSKETFSQLDQRLVNVSTRMVPVLKSFENHALYLKHQLNARAVETSLTMETADIEKQIGELVGSMENSIHQAKEFQQELDKSAGL